MYFPPPFLSWLAFCGYGGFSGYLQVNKTLIFLLSLSLSFVALVFLFPLDLSSSTRQTELLGHCVLGRAATVALLSPLCSCASAWAKLSGRGGWIILVMWHNLEFTMLDAEVGTTLWCWTHQWGCAEDERLWYGVRNWSSQKGRMHWSEELSEFWLVWSRVRTLCNCCTTTKGYWLELTTEYLCYIVPVTFTTARFSSVHLDFFLMCAPFCKLACKIKLLYVELHITSLFFPILGTS